MKLRQKPEDFQVEEITDVVAGSTGEFAFYRLDKTGWTTPDALAILRRKWKIHHRRISYGGLKDRHAVTSQHFTIFRGPSQDLEHQRFRVKYLGQLTEPYTSTNIRSNRFTIVMRDMSLQEAETAVQVADSEVAAIGYPNYFDDQRFGSVGEGSAFIAKYMLQANWEAALWQALAAPYEYDRAADKRLKQLLRAYWGQWTSLRELLPKSHARSLVCYLADHPQDYKGAVARLRPELKGLYVAAYQSWLWNQALAVWLEQRPRDPANQTWLPTRPSPRAGFSAIALDGGTFTSALFPSETERPRMVASPFPTGAPTRGFDLGAIENPWLGPPLLSERGAGFMRPAPAATLEHSRG